MWQTKSLRNSVKALLEFSRKVAILTNVLNVYNFKFSQKTAKLTARSALLRNPDSLRKVSKHSLNLSRLVRHLQRVQMIAYKMKY